MNRVLLISTYELGRQPFGLASPAARLRSAGFAVDCLDLSREPFRPELVKADLIAFHLPMHTATRLAVPVVRRVRRLNAAARLCCYGLYAPLNASFLKTLGVHDILGGEFEDELVKLAEGRFTQAVAVRLGEVPRVQFRVPDRKGLPAPSRYATLQYGASRRVVGYTEASRGCKHGCRHCPIVPVYNGQFRVVPVGVVLGDIRAQVDQGVQHITFGDPDFFNGISHAMRVVDGFAREFSGLTYDVTIKVEHLLRYGDRLDRLTETGCVLVTSAFEAFDDHVLATLLKGHTRADAHQAVERCRNVGLALAPTFMAFTPWTTLSSYCDLLSEIDRLQLVNQVAPIQLAIRLLVPEGSDLLRLDELHSCLEPFDPIRLVYPWRHRDPNVDALCEEVGQLVGRRLTASRGELFAEVWELAHERAGLSRPRLSEVPGRTQIPYLNEPWYC